MRMQQRMWMRAMTMAADADFPTGEMAPADATFCGSLFFFAHAAETVSDATTDAATEMVTAAGSSLSFCSFAAAQETDADADVTLQIGTEAWGLLSLFHKRFGFFPVLRRSNFSNRFLFYFIFPSRFLSSTDLTSGHFSFSGFLHSLCLSAGSFCGRIPDPVRKSRFHL